jgi:hypothetical protein
MFWLVYSFDDILTNRMPSAKSIPRVQLNVTTVVTSTKYSSGVFENRGQVLFSSGAA